jgi:hypothetical protein
MGIKAEKINSFLGVFNFFLLIVIAGMLVYMFYDNRRGKGNMVFLEEGDEIKVYVVEDNIFNGYLKNKLVRVISLNPLYLEILPQNVQVGKNGIWNREIYNETAKVKNAQEPFIYIKGKIQQNSED